MKTDKTEEKNDKDDKSSSVSTEEVPYADQIEYYAGRHISSCHGRIHWWLGAVYLILFLWALYYGVTYWGGLGPGLDY